MAKKNNKVRVDMTGVESYGLLDAGKYRAKVVEAEVNTNGQGNDQIRVVFQVTAGEHKGAKITNFFVLVDAALWKLKEFLDACGMKSDGKISIDVDKLVGKLCEIVVYEDDYQGTPRSRISNYAKLSGGKAKAKDEDDDEDEDEDDDEDEDEDDEDEPEPPKKKKKAAPPAKKSKAKKKPDPEDDEDEDDEDDEDEEDEEPPKKSKKAAKKPAKKAAPKKSSKKSKKDEDEDEDDDWDDEDDDWDEDDD